MRRVLLLMSLLCAGCWASARPQVDDEPEAKKPAEGKEKPADPTKGVEAPVTLPDDEAGRLLGGVLPPTKRPGLLDNPTRPAASVLRPPVLPGLDPVLPEAPPAAPRMVPVKRLPPRPRTVTPEEVDEGFGPPAPPALATMETLPKDKERGEDVRQPPGVPYLGLRPEDRVPLDDPTAEASGAAILKGAMPDRDKPVPYARSSVPEPFEFRGPPAPAAPERLSPQVAAPVPPEKKKP